MRKLLFIIVFVFFAVSAFSDDDFFDNGFKIRYTGKDKTTVYCAEIVSMLNQIKLYSSITKAMTKYVAEDMIYSEEFQTVYSSYTLIQAFITTIKVSIETFEYGNESIRQLQKLLLQKMNIYRNMMIYHEKDDKEMLKKEGEKYMIAGKRVREKIDELAKLLENSRKSNK